MNERGGTAVRPLSGRAVFATRHYDCLCVRAKKSDAPPRAISTIGDSQIPLFVEGAAPPVPVFGADMTRGADSVGVDAVEAGVAAAIAVVTVGVDAVEVDAVEVAAGVDAAEQVVLETVFVSIVTAPFRANARPDTVAPFVRLMLVSARTFPTNSVPVPTSAELPICQNTLHGLPPPIISTEELLAVVSVLPVLKMNTALPSPSASRVSTPVNWADDG